MPDWNAIDVVVVAAYLVLIVAIGVWAGRGERDATDYFLAGRTLPWYLIGLSFFASNMSGASFVGLIGASYSHGMTVYNYEWTAALVLIVFALTILPVFLRCRLFTVPEYLEARFDRRARLTYAVFTILALLFIDMAGALYAGGVVISTVFPAVSVWQVSAALAVVAGLYTLIGGLRAVVVTDAVQAVLIIAGAAAIVWVGLPAVGGWDALLARLNPVQTALMRPADDGFLPWPGILGIVVLGFYYWTLNQYFVQRALAARSLAEARAGALFGGLLKLPNVMLMVVPGMIALALFPDLDSPDRAFPTLAFELLPVGLRGLLLTALIAAVMSSLDSAMNAAASLLTMDIVRGARPGMRSRTLLGIGRLFTGALILVAALYAPLIERFGSLFEYFQSTLAYLVPPIVAVYLGGLYVRRLPMSAGFPALAGGLALGAGLFLAKEATGLWTGLGLPDIHFSYMALIMLALTAVLLAAAGLGGSPVPANLTMRREDLGRGGGWRGDHRGQAAALGLLTVVLIALVW